MNINFKRSLRALLPAAFALTIPGAAWADPGDPPEVEAQRLVHILGYTAADYGGAVTNGAIVNETEYEEQIALLTDAAKIAKRLEGQLPAGAPSAKLVAGVEGVRALVNAKASEARVGAAVAEVRATITSSFRLSEAPSAPPDAARGQALYAEHCATCHGADGHADTPRAASLNPRPASFHDAKVADALTPLRVSSTVRFGINGTAMVPFSFLSDADRWALAFHVTGLRHAAAPASGSPTYTLAELSVRSDEDLRRELASAGVAGGRMDSVLADLRRRAPYEDRARSSPLSLARSRLDRAKIAIARGEREAARGHIIDAYLEGIEPAEGPLRATDAALVNALEEKFIALRARLESGAPAPDLDASIGALLGDVTRAELLLAASAEKPSFASTALSAGGILLREGVEAALLIAALLGIATRSSQGTPGAPAALSQEEIAQRKRWVHLGWGSAVLLGLVTWFVSAKVVAISGARRELIEGVTALLATGVLFYVSFTLLAKKEVARWMKFLRAQVSPRRAALSLFGVSFLAAYREAFETVLFFQALLSSHSKTSAVLAGVAGGALILVGLVIAYTRAGRFAPPQVFFKISSALLYALAVVFAGQGVAALQLTGAASIHPLAIPSVPALGLHPTVETCAAQAALLALAVIGVIVARRQAASPSALAPQEGAGAKPVTP